MSISSDDDTDTTELDGKYDSELHPDVDMRMEDDVDALDGVDLDVDVKMERDHEDEEDEESEEKQEEEEVNEDEEEDEDEDNGKELRTIGPGEIVKSPADAADTMVDDQPTVLPELGQDMREHTPWPQPTVPAPQPQTLEPHPQPTNSGNSHPQRAGVAGACDAA